MTVRMLRRLLEEYDDNEELIVEVDGVDHRVTEVEGQSGVMRFRVVPVKQD